MHRCTFFVGLFLLLLAPSLLQAYEEGDVIVLTTAENGIRRGAAQVDNPPLGAVFTVREVRGEWLAASRGKPGWIWERDVISLSEAIDYFTSSIAQNDADTAAFGARANVYTYLGQYQDALDDFNKAIELAPTAHLYNERGNTYVALGDYQQAVRDYDRALGIGGEDAIVLGNRGDAYYRLEDYAQAIADLDLAVELDPQRAMFYFRRAKAYRDAGKYEQAIDDFAHAVELDRKDYLSRSQLAWILASAPEAVLRDGEAAVESASTACRLSDWQAIDPLEALAAAYAETGDFDSAVRYQEQAVELGQDTPYADLYVARLALYRREQPYRYAAGADHHATPASSRAPQGGVNQDSRPGISNPAN